MFPICPNALRLVANRNPFGLCAVGYAKSGNRWSRRFDVKIGMVEGRWDWKLCAYQSTAR